MKGYYRAYGRRSHRSWRSRGFARSSGHSNYAELFSMFGSGGADIRSALLSLKADALGGLLQDYGANHGGRGADAELRRTSRRGGIDEM